MNCDPLARSYRWLEYMRYGKALERCRATMLPYLAHARKVLVIGDGDGRFLTAFLLHNRTATVDSIDVSRRMLEIAHHRMTAACSQNSTRVTLQHGDIRTTPQPGHSYDLVVTHFFFDVFSTAELKDIVDRVSRWTTPDALWLISEFDLPPSGWHRVKARFWLRAMYSFFRVAASLRNQQLPCWRPLLREAGFVPQRQARYQNGFIVSELWQRG
jgi:ubiquinone/menaquinone biosynthesis C-methylase UbiE